MRKEILIAILAGILFGSLAAYGIWKANSAFGSKGDVLPSETSTETSTQEPISPPASPQPLSFTLSNPLENQVFGQSPIMITGVTHSNSWIAISDEDNDYIKRANNDGTFEQEVELSGGFNQLMITVFDDSGNSHTQILPVLFSSGFQTQPTSDPQKDLQAAVKKQALAYLGTVTDKTENSLQVKDQKGALLLISIDPGGAGYVRLSDSGQKEASYADVAIGDFIAALGYVESNGVLTAKRIILTSPPGIPDRKAIQGTITNYAKKKVDVKGKDGLSYTVTPSKSVAVTSGDTQEKAAFTDLEEGQNVILGTIQEKTDLVARRVQILQ